MPCATPSRSVVMLTPWRVLPARWPEAHYGGVPAEIQAEVIGRLDIALRAEVMAFARQVRCSAYRRLTPVTRPSPRHLSERDPDFQMKDS